MGPFQKSITKEEVNKMPLQSFNGEIVVVDTEEQILEATNYLKDQSVLGFDTETRPSFKKGRVNGVALLQLSSDTHSFLFRINKIGLPGPLVKILSDPQILKVGVAIKDDIKGLQKFHSFKSDGFLELQEYVGQLGIESYSLKKLTAIVLNFRISKRQQVSNWEASELSAGQLRYAATDAWVSLKIFERLEECQSQ